MEVHADSDTIKRIAELQRQDVERLRKGKHKEGDLPSDFELAAQLHEKELESLEVFASDRTMCQSVMTAVVQDGAAIQSHEEMEQQAREDRQQALGQPRSTPTLTKEDDTEHEIGDEILRKLQNLYVFDEKYDNLGESSEKGGKKSTKDRNVETAECAVCGEGISPYDMVECPCSHKYCTTCVIRLVEAAIGDESLFPPRCCTRPLPLLLLRCVIPTELFQNYQQKEIEYSTTDRTYCSVATCSEFIPPKLIEGDVAVCHECKKETCVFCKKLAHAGDCAKDQATADLLILAEKSGWQRCSECRRMVELHVGCNHISMYSHRETSDWIPTTEY